MIPTVEDILLDLAAGKISHAQAMAWMEQHFKLCVEEACALPEVGALDALRELVTLKDMKDGFGVEPFGAHNNATARADYERRKPLAWAAARAVFSPQKAPTE